MSSSIGRAASVYFALVFAGGFLLGTARVLLIAPQWGELQAVLLELPIMLVVSWVVCGASVRMFDIHGRYAGLTMGAVAFALLLIAEMTLSIFVFDRWPVEFLRAYGTVAGAVGLAGQIAFGFMPLLRSGGQREEDAASAFR